MVSLHYGGVKMDTGELIKDIRVRSGMTQAELAERLGVTPQAISQYERGVKKPKIETVSRIARALDVPATVLFPDSDPSFDVIIREGNALESLAMVVKLSEIREEKVNGNKPTVESREKILSEKIPYFAKQYVVPADLLKSDAQWYIDEYWKKVREQNKGQNASILSALQSRMLELMNTMNATGQRTAVERVSEHAQLPQYQEKHPAGDSTQSAGTGDENDPE